MSKAIIESIRDWFMECDVLKEEYPIGVDFLTDIKSYAIDTLPTNPIYKRYVDGRNLYQFDFTFTSKEAFDGDSITALENCEFYSRLSEWVKEQGSAGNLPELDGHRSQMIEETTHGYLYTVDSDLARYQAQFKLIYT